MKSGLSPAVKRFAAGLGDPKLRPFYWLFSLILATSFAMVLVERGTNEQFTTFFDGIWWSVITFSTTGYGDKVPSTVGGKILGILTVFFGIGATTLLSGTLASFLVARNSRARSGLMELNRIKNHLIICGWKNNMAEILLDIIRVSKDVSVGKIVVVSNIEPERIDALRDTEELKDIQYVRGDYSSEAALSRANVKYANKVLILADVLDKATPSEVDSKTVMTVLTARSLSKDVYICAEVLDKKYESYLKHAQCDEILFSRVFSRRMLANTSATNGMSHIIFELLSQENSASRLGTVEIPEEFLGGNYGDFRATFAGASGRLLLGILENTGSPNHMKLESLREAQKTSDVSQLIVNLQKVKGLEVNKPVLMPDDDYLIQKHSMAIVLEKV